MCCAGYRGAMGPLYEILSDGVAHGEALSHTRTINECQTISGEIKIAENIDNLYVREGRYNGMLARRERLPADFMLVFEVQKARDDRRILVGFWRRRLRRIS